jgi:hypothetical protein
VVRRPLQAAGTKNMTYDPGRLDRLFDLDDLELSGRDYSAEFRCRVTASSPPVSGRLLQMKISRIELGKSLQPLQVQNGRVPRFHFDHACSAK